MARKYGRRWAAVRAKFRTQCAKAGAPCWLCSDRIDYRLPVGHPDAWEPDHFYPVATHPHLEYDIGNLRASHLTCNRSRGDRTPVQLGVLSEQWLPLGAS